MFSVIGAVALGMFFLFSFVSMDEINTAGSDGGWWFVFVLAVILGLAYGAFSIHAKYGFKGVGYAVSALVLAILLMSHC